MSEQFLYLFWWASLGSVATSLFGHNAPPLLIFLINCLMAAVFAALWNG